MGERIGPRATWRHGRRAAVVAALALTAATVVVVAAAPAGADVVTGSNTTAIAVPATGSPNQIGPAAPYPSAITISGLTGTVSDVDVTLSDVSHTIAADIDVLLVGPEGQNLILMSDAASGGGYPVNGTLTFDDAAAGPIPAVGAVGTGTFQPTNGLGDDTFPPGAPAPSSATTLSVFNGTAGNGTWQLYVVDDATGDVGSIAGGWSITVTTDVVAQPGALHLSAATYRGAEGDGAVTITVDRTGGTDGPVSARLTTTTPATATAGSDFTPLDQIVTFADGQTTASVDLPIIDDDEVEGVDETVTVALSDPTGGATIGTPATALVTIDDDDATFDTTPIVIPAAGSGATSGAPAAPYPASIHVTGQPGPIGGVEIAVNGFGHTVPIDVDILLVGPGGQSVVLMSDVGGTAPVSGIDLVFSDAGTGPIPAGGPLVSGTFTPSDDDVGGTDPFPAPAPTPSDAIDLGAFVGIDPNGTWSLYIVDDASADTGVVAGGWSLTFLPASPVVVADAGGPYTIDEGAPLGLDATGSTAAPTATYAWDLDDDGLFDDATGPTPTLTATDLTPLGLADGPAGPLPVAVRVTDTTVTDTADTTVTVTNLAPVATIDVPTPVIAGTPVTIKVGAVDPSPVDAAGLFDYAIDWEGDGIVDLTLTGPADPPATHTYPTAGEVGLTVTATDKDGATSAPTVQTITVQPAAAAPTDPTVPGAPGTPGTPGTPGAPDAPGSAGEAPGSDGGRRLPVTGGDIGWLLLAAAGAFTAGGALLGARRRQERRPTDG